jgi:hypothetical protein
LDTSRNRFGTTPSCFFTASSSGWEAAGAASMAAGVGMRDMAISSSEPWRLTPVK